MLTAKTLTTLANAAAAIHGGNALDIAAADARMVAESASGYGTPETLALAIVVDNDRKTAERVQAMVRRIADGPSETKTADLADALSGIVEDLAGFEGLTVRGPSAQLVGDSDGTYVLPDVTAALARAAFRNVDWIGWADHYLREHALNEGPS